MASMEKFTQRARRVLALAHQEAEHAHQGLIGTEHLLIGLIEEDGGVAGRVLRELGLEQERVREMVSRLGGEGRYQDGRIELAPDTQLVLEAALEEARKMGHHYVGTEHLLLALVRTEGDGCRSVEETGGHRGPGAPPDAPRPAGEQRVPPLYPKPPSRRANRTPRPRWWTSSPPI